MTDPQPTRADQFTVGRLRAYEVISPEYESSSGGAFEPPEWGRDYRLVYARTARRAKILAVRAWRRMNRNRWGWRRLPLAGRIRCVESLTSEWLYDNEGSGRPPWEGFKALISPTEAWIETNFPIPEDA